MTRAIDPLPPTTDDPSDLTALDMLREAIFFAIIVGAIAGGGYGLFAGWASWTKVAAAERGSAAIIALWGLGWALGGAVGVGLLCAIFGGAFALLTNFVKKMSRR
jgi:hypothetical protein